MTKKKTGAEESPTNRSSSERYGSFEMFNSINKNFYIASTRPPASAESIQKILVRFPEIPIDYIELVKESAGIELFWKNDSFKYLRIHTPEFVIESDEAHGFNRFLPGSIPLGDNGGGGEILFFNGKNGLGLYRVSHSVIDENEAVWISHSLTDLLVNGLGVLNCGTGYDEDDEESQVN